VKPAKGLHIERRKLKCKKIGKDVTGSNMMLLMGDVKKSIADISLPIW